MRVRIPLLAVKAETAPLRPSYRNDAVYRSATRLLASRPKKPTERRPARWRFFLAGSICGGVLVLLLLWPALTVAPETRVSAAGMQPTSKQKPARTSPNRSDAPTNALPEKTSLAVILDSPVAVSREATSPPESRRAPVAEAIPSPTGTRRTTPPPATTTAVGFASVLKLRGQQSPHAGPPMEVEFELIITRGSRGNSVHGSVRHFDEVNLVSFHRLQGRVTDGLSGEVIIVSEITPASRTTPSIPGRIFTIELPGDPNATELTGTWSQHGAPRGRLVLKNVPVVPKP